MLGKWATKGVVIEMKGLAMAMVSGGGESIFPGVADEIEGKGAQVENSLGTGLI